VASQKNKKMPNQVIALLCLVCVVILWSSCTVKKGVLIPQQYKSGNTTLPYNIYYPESYKKDTKLPIIIFLHGSGERGVDNQKQNVHVIPYLTSPEIQSQYPAVIISPQCPENQTWSPVDRQSWRPLGSAPMTSPGKALMALIDKISKDRHIEPNRIYIIGLSMGGFGTFDLVSRNPQRFAAAAPICGGADLDKMADYAHVPMWIFHGAQDDVVPVRLSQEAYQKLVDLGGRASYTEFAEGNHSVWEEAVRTPGFMDWLFAQYRGKDIR
jgi:predicted peptidase